MVIGVVGVAMVAAAAPFERESISAERERERGGGDRKMVIACNNFGLKRVCLGCKKRKEN